MRRIAGLKGTTETFQPINNCYGQSSLTSPGEGGNASIHEQIRPRRRSTKACGAGSPRTKNTL